MLHTTLCPISSVGIPAGWTLTHQTKPSGVVDVWLSNPAYSFSPVLGSDHTYEKAVVEAVRQVTNLIARSAQH